MAPGLPTRVPRAHATGRLCEGRHCSWGGRHQGAHHLTALLSCPLCGDSTGKALLTLDPRDGLLGHWLPRLQGPGVTAAHGARAHRGLCAAWGCGPAWRLGEASLDFSAFWKVPVSLAGALLRRQSHELHLADPAFTHTSLWPDGSPSFGTHVIGLGPAPCR